MTKMTKEKKKPTYQNETKTKNRSVMMNILNNSDVE
jgi:hypothetical protein